jgi:hypothetical protein
MSTTLCKQCAAFSIDKKSNCVAGMGNPEAPLAIFLNKPDMRAVAFLGWLLDKCSLSPEDVYIDFILKCAVKKAPKSATSQKKSRLVCAKICTSRYSRPGLKATSIVAAGEWAIEALIDKPMKTVAGIKDPTTGVWAIYDPMYHIMNAGECVRSYRVLYSAAVEDGLQPEYNPEVPMFDFAMK